MTLAEDIQVYHNFHQQGAVVRNGEGIPVSLKAWYSPAASPVKDRYGVEFHVKRYPEQASCSCDDTATAGGCKCNWTFRHDVVGLQGERFMAVLRRAAAECDSITRCIDCRGACMATPGQHGRCPSCLVQEMVDQAATASTRLHTCPVCFEDKRSSQCVELPCLHSLCVHCARVLMARSPACACPMCRGSFSKVSVLDHLPDF